MFLMNVFRLEHRALFQIERGQALARLREPLELEEGEGFRSPPADTSPDCQPVVRPSSRTRNQSNMSIRGFRLAIVYASCMYDACRSQLTPKMRSGGLVS